MALIATASGGNSAGPLNFLGASLIVVRVSWATASPVTGVTDTLGNVYLPLTVQNYNSGAGALRLFYCSNPLTGAAVVVAATNGTLVVDVFSGFAAYASVQNGASSASATSISTGQVTPVQLNSLIVTGFNALGAISVDSGFTPASSSSLAYLVGSSNVNPTWTVSGATPLAAVIAVFNPYVPQSDWSVKDLDSGWVIKELK